jgi:hypothetical protein
MFENPPLFKDFDEKSSTRIKLALVQCNLPTIQSPKTLKKYHFLLDTMNYFSYHNVKFKSVIIGSGDDGYLRRFRVVGPLSKNLIFGSGPFFWGGGGGWALKGTRRNF